MVWFIPEFECVNLVYLGGVYLTLVDVVGVFSSPPIRQVYRQGTSTMKCIKCFFANVPSWETNRDWKRRSRDWSWKYTESEIDNILNITKLSIENHLCKRGHFTCFDGRLMCLLLYLNCTNVPFFFKRKVSVWQQRKKQGTADEMKWYRRE